MSDSTPNVKRARIFYARVDETARKEDKYKFLDDAGSVSGVEWQELHPDAKHTWLTEGMRAEFENFLPIGTKATRQGASEHAEAIFKMFSLGVSTNRDATVYNFDREALAKKVEQFSDEYNAEVTRYQQKGMPKDLDAFLKYDGVKWSRNLKRDLRNGVFAAFDSQKIRKSAYRPFTKKHLYFDDIGVDEPGRMKQILPESRTEFENRIMCVSDAAWRSSFSVLLTDAIPDLHLCASLDGYQCFPLYTYDEDGTNRRENITGWSLAQFRAKYADESIAKLDIFHYVYALLHHPTYRATYAANLKRELPRIPFVATREDFRRFAQAGARLADLHVNYEAQPAYKLDAIENPQADLDWRVERMRLAKDKGSIIYNDFLTLAGIPPEAFEYRLGNRSALEWIIDQYQVSTDK